MSVWHLGEIEVRSGGTSSDMMVESNLKSAHYSFGPPPGCWPVDVNDDWTLHQWCKQEAKALNVELKTDYSESDDDMPEEVKRSLKQSSEPGKVY